MAHVDQSVASSRDLNEKTSQEQLSSSGELDWNDYHDTHAGRLVVDPEEARLEFGDKAAATLKLSEDRTIVLWPQPSDDPDDPQNWSASQKAIQLTIITLAAIVPDFDSGIGIASVFALAEQYDTTTGVINDLTSNWSIFLLGWGSIFAVMLMRRYGRLPVLFWSQLFAVAFLVGCTFAPNLATFTAMRCLTAFFGTCPQVTGLYVVTDMFPFHLQARKLNIWTMGFVISPFLSPFLFGFLVARTSWRWAYGIGSIYGAIVVALIAFFGRETLYDRNLKPSHGTQQKGFVHRVQTLIGITGTVNLIWRPHFLSILIFEGLVFGFNIGITVTLAVFLGESPPVGFGLSQIDIAACYAMPIVSVVIGELLGRFLNDWIMRTSIRRNHGVFEAENRLWACYCALPVLICGYVLLGASLRHHLSLGILILGWGLSEVATMVVTTAVYALCNDCFPRHQGEVSALVNLARTLGGFAVPYFQLPWAEKSGALVLFGTEVGIISAVFVLVVPFLQLKGRSLRERFSA